MKQFYFERLEVWKETRIFIKEVYEFSSDFPSDERFGAISQIRRASVSIAANIAEGMHRKTDREKARFINIAFSSAIEVLSFLILAKDFEWIDDDRYLASRKRLEKITNQLNSLYEKLKNSETAKRNRKG